MTRATGKSFVQKFYVPFLASPQSGNFRTAMIGPLLILLQDNPHTHIIYEEQGWWTCCSKGRLLEHASLELQFAMPEIVIVIGRCGRYVTLKKYPRNLELTHQTIDFPWPGEVDLPILRDFRPPILPGKGKGWRSWGQRRHDVSFDGEGSIINFAGEVLVFP